MKFFIVFFILFTLNAQSEVLLTCFCTTNQKVYELIREDNSHPFEYHSSYSLEEKKQEDSGPSDRLMLLNGTYMNPSEVINDYDKFYLYTKYNISATRNPGGIIRDINTFEFHVDKQSGKAQYTFKQKLNFITIKKEKYHFIQCE